jgi:hypothetical protein
VPEAVRWVLGTINDDLAEGRGPSRQLLQVKALDIENDLRGTLRNFGLSLDARTPRCARRRSGRYGVSTES